MRPAPAAVYGSQVRFISAAPSVRPVIEKLIGLPGAGSVNWPSVSKVRVPPAPEMSNGAPAVPPLTSSPAIDT
jgi:hypothetical protein